MTMSTVPTPGERDEVGEVGSAMAEGRGDEPDRLAEPSPQELSLTGHPVLDDHHQKVGTVSDVLYDERGEARWAVVNPGPLRAEHYVPVEGSYMTNDGSVVIPYGKEQIKTAAKASRDHVLDSSIERELIDHYELTNS
jgi:PRC-barrel domain